MRRYLVALLLGGCGFIGDGSGSGDGDGTRFGFGPQAVLMACENINDVCDVDTDCDAAVDAQLEIECSREPDYFCMADAERCEDIVDCDMGNCE